MALTDHELRCAGCDVVVALAASPHALRTRVYCSDYCLWDSDPEPPDVRNEYWRAIHLTKGVSAVAIARVFGVHHANVYRMLKNARP